MLIGEDIPRSERRKATSQRGWADVSAASGFIHIVRGLRAAFDRMLYGGLLHPPSGEGQAGAGRHGLSLVSNLILLVAIVTLPLLCLGTSALFAQYSEQRATAEAQLVTQAQSIALLVDGEFARTQAVADTLAAAAPLPGADLTGFEAELRAASARLSKGLPPGNAGPVVSYMDAHGVWLLHTAWPPGERRTGLLATEFGRAAIAEGQPQISDLFIMPTSRVPGVGLAVPIVSAEPGTGGQSGVTGGIGIAIPRQRLLAIIQDAGFPAGGVATVLDRKGIVVARSMNDAETVGREPTAGVMNVISARRSGVIPAGMMTLENVPAVGAFAHAPRTDYIVKIDVPDEVFLAPLHRSLIRSAMIAGIVITAGLALAVLAANRIIRAFRFALGTATGGDRTSVKSTGLQEADEFAALLTTTFAEREQAVRNARALIDNSPIGIMIFDTAGQVHEANDALLLMLGRNRAALADSGLQWNARTPEAWAGVDDAALAEAFATGHCTPYEKQYRRPDGVLVPVLISFALLSRASDLAAAFVMDLTDQRTAEEARLESEDRLSFSLRAGRLGAWELDLSKREVHCSEITKTLFGRGRLDEFGFDDFIAAIHRDDRARVVASGYRAIRAMGDYQIEYRVIWPDRTLHWIEARGRALVQAGTSTRLAGVCVDITERRQAEVALRESETRLRAITDTMPQIVWSARPDGYHDYFNQRWYDLTGTTVEQTAGEGWNPAFHPDDQGRAWERWRQSLATGEPYEIEHRLRMADGSYRWMLGRALPVRDEDTGEIRRWFGTCTDIEETVAARQTLATSRDELERLIAERTRDLQDTQARLAQAQRIQALGLLAGGIAHDFNNVLQAVQGGGVLLERRPGDPDGVRRIAGMLLDVADRGASVTRRLLAFSRQGDLRAEPLKPDVVLAGMGDILSHTLGDGVKVVVKADADLPPMLADKGQLETVLINLATNGRDAMSGIGTLELTAALEVVSRGKAVDHRGGLKAGRYVRLAVSDSGLGMSSDTLARASEPFFTTKPTGHGTGLGLAMARGFAEQSGGGIHLASAPGRGTTVTLWFPVATAELHDEEGADAAGSAILARQTGARLLLVDDDPIVRDLTAEVLEGSGFVVLTADCATAALTVLGRGGTVDLLISDLSMPDMDGVSLIKEAQRRMPSLPAILLTGFATNDAELAVDGAVSGAFSLLRKPIQGAVLADRVASILNGVPVRG